MQLLPTLSLSNKILASFILASTSSIVLALSLIAYYDYLYIKDNLREEAQTTAKMLAQSVAAPLIFQDKESASNTLNVLKNSKKIDSAIIRDSHEDIFASYYRLQNPAAQEQWSLFGETQVLASEKIVFDQEQLGYAQVALNLSSLHSRLDQYTKSLISALCICLAFLALMVGVIRNTLATPLQKLVGFVQKVTQQQNYTQRIQHQRHDEIGSLINSFNKMLEAIEFRDQQLKEHNDGLEKLVALRSEQLHHRANFDALTDLPNRHLLLDRLEQGIISAQRHQQQFSVLFLDLDRFKRVNDNFGHATGDKLLIQVAKRLKQLLRSEDTVSRLGGDEFVILLHDIKSPADAEHVASNIIEALSTPVDIGNRQLHTSTSIGIACYPADGDNAELLIKHADTSMYHAKQKGVGNFAFYTPQFDANSLSRLSMETEMRSAFQENRYELYYQPQHDSHSQQLTGFECLIRLRSISKTIISPIDFIPIAEETGLVSQIGLWVTNQACAKLEHFHSLGHDELNLSVNISAHHLMEDDFAQQILGIALNYEFDLKNLEIELTEASMLIINDKTHDNLQTLRSHGICIAIDDFGTGYASLNYLRNLPASTIKIDGSFIRDLETDIACQGIVSSTIMLGHSLGLKVVAECVENQQQLEFLQRYNCNTIQGYFFSQPMPEKQLDRYLSKKLIVEAIHVVS